MRQLYFLFIGILFGIIMFKSEAASWFRIYEMFQFQSFHMYGIIGSALFFGVILIQLIKRFKLKSVFGESIRIPDKDKSFYRYMLGGIIFGLGWGLIGCCPGPIFILLGTGIYAIGLVLIGALLGTYIYGMLKDILPH